MGMFRAIFLFFVFFSLSGFSQTGSSSRSVNRFKTGEHLVFRLGYGWFTLGRADLKIEPALVTYQNKPCYKVEIEGKTTGILGAFSKVDDLWGAYVDSETLLPMLAYSDIHEGNYSREEAIHFDQAAGKIRVEMTKRKKVRPTKYYETDKDVHDMISGYLHMRNIDFRRMSVGDTVRFQAFYDEIFYDFGVVYDGKEEIKTKVGDLMAYRIIPVIPENEIFPGTNPITAWISADSNQLPLVIKADMFFGSAVVELTDYKNIRYGPDFQP